MNNTPMTQYTQRLALAVPEQLIPQTNNLACIVGESAADVNTFKQAIWQDTAGNLYAVCSTVAKPVVSSLFGKTINPDNVPAHATDADIAQAQQALDSIVVYGDGVTVDPAYIVLAIDHEPLIALGAMGLTRIEHEDPIT